MPGRRHLPQLWRRWRLSTSAVVMLLVRSHPWLQQPRLRLGRVVGAALLVWWGWVPPLDSSTPASCARAANGAWAGVEWTNAPTDHAAIRRLAHMAEAARLRYLFVFTAYRKPDGSWSSTAPFAATFVRTFRATNRTTTLLAWVGVPSQSTTFGDPPTRAELSVTLAALVYHTGYDGIHIDAEPVADGDQGYLALLAELRGALTPQSLLSVAALPWGTSVELALGAGGYRWSGGYYRAVAGEVDQLVTMSYDSHMPHPALYRLWMREQVRHIRASLADTRTSLIIGISVAREATASHDPQVEDLANGVAGICAALGLPSSGGAGVAGVSLYALWEMRETDWKLWAQWLR